MAPQHKASSIPPNSLVRVREVPLNTFTGSRNCPAIIASRAAAREPMINSTPPMVGVPCLARCQAGPSSRMVCPNFSRCSTGMRTFPSRAAIRKPASAAPAVTVNVVASIVRPFLSCGAIRHRCI